MTREASFACPHCGRHFAQCSGPAHAATCIRVPGMAARVRAALEDPDRPGIALSVRAYDGRAAQYSAAGHDALTRHWGPTWADVARRVGLEPGQKAGTRAGTHTAAQKAVTEAAALSEVEAALEADAALREHWRTRGMEACSARRLPDGRTAWMLR